MNPGPTPALQLACLGIVLLYLLLRLRRPDRAVFARRFGLLVASSWLAEDTAIRLYGFYFYDPGWWLFIDQVPLLIVCIWPVVIHSALDLIERWLPRLSPARLAVVGGFVILTDAALIEPIAVHCGLWRWTEPGLFEVPPIGILGWAYFTGLALWTWRRPMHRAWVLVVAPVGTHLLLLASWWGLFRHVNGTIEDGFAVGGSVVVAVGAALAIGRTTGAGGVTGSRPLLADGMMRAPGALFFFALLIGFALDRVALVAYTCAFAVPWLVLLARSSRISKSEISGTSGRAT
ncbi:MAG TPA: hypothetical protein PK095_01885 [Myxococcota bacterium]|nr:hypothetical protein [Myxococcota bacterium]